MTVCQIFFKLKFSKCIQNFRTLNVFGKFLLIVYANHWPKWKWFSNCNFNWSSEQNSGGIPVQGCIHRSDRCDRGHTYIFRYLNPIPTRGADSAHHWQGRTKIFLVVTSLFSINWWIISLQNKRHRLNLKRDKLLI